MDHIVNMLTTIVFLPLIAGFVLLFLPDRLRPVLQKIALVISAAVFVLGVMIFAGVGTGEYSHRLLSLGEFDLDIHLTAQPLRSFMLLFAMGFGLLINVYALKGSTDVSRGNIFYGAVLLSIGGSAGILLSEHLIFLLICWEIVTASLYLLVSTGGRGSNFAATKSFAMIGFSDAAFMFGIFLVWSLCDSFLISDVRLSTSSALPVIAFFMFITAALTKAGALPFHTWLPSSGESAPTSVMALLPAAIDKLLGIYLLVIIVNQLFVLQAGVLSFILALIGSATIVVAVMIAMVQHNLKKLLSYHAVSQVGYMILGIATMTPVGLAGAVFHMLNNAIYKCGLFLCGGAAQRQSGTPELDELGGLGKKMPITFVTCLIAALSISGIPPLNGFVSKWMVYQGVIKMGNEQIGITAGLWPLWLVAAMFGSALTLASFVKLTHSIFLSRLPEKLKGITEAPLSMTVPMIILAGLCIFFGVFYYVPLNYFIYPALNAVGVQTEAVIFGTWASGLATILIVIGILLGLVIVLLSLIGRKVREVPTWTCGEIQSNEEMTIAGTHFYKTVSSMGGLKQLYADQEKGYFDLYDQSGNMGLGLSGFLRWLHSGILPVYLTWVTLGLMVILFIICNIW